LLPKNQTMKFNLLTFLLFIPTIFYSQNSIDKTIYLDSTWNETTIENHKYYRIVKDYNSDIKTYVIKDYYKSGVLQMEGKSRTKDDISKEGEFIFYYENGNKKAVTNYEKSLPKGKHFEWYENGAKKLEGKHISRDKILGAELRIDQFWNKDGIQTIIDGFGDYQDTNEKFSESGKIKNGFKDGLWKGEHFEKKINYIETYVNGKLISGTSTDFENNKYNYNVVSSKPTPKKGSTNFSRYIQTNFKVPEYKIKGQIVTLFFVEKDGSVVEVKTIKSLFKPLDEEAIRVIKSYNEWIPGTIRGQNVRVSFTVPITVESARKE
jgi:antitoxin component YwqK of YwqJK toxin-antitoxin module